MIQLIRKYIYKNRISILFGILVLGILLYSFFFASNQKVDSNNESFNEENNKSPDKELKIMESENVKDNEILYKDHSLKKLKSETEDNKNIWKKNLIFVLIIFLLLYSFPIPNNFFFIRTPFLISIN